LDLLRRDGWQAHVVEKYNHHARVRVDAFGFGDVLACKPGGGVLLVQATSGSNHSARVHKATALPELRTWLQAGGLFAVWSWTKRKGRWCCRREPLSLLDLPILQECQSADSGIVADPMKL
jgi:hypothetical protein